MLNNEMILADLLLQHGISHIVFSTDGQNSALYQIISQRSEYRTYCCVDERSAAYFAMGLVIESRTPAAVVCRSHINAGHFFPAATEAFYQNLPLLMLVELDEAMAGEEVSVSAPFASVARHSTDLPAAANARSNVTAVNYALEQLTLWGGSPVFLSYAANVGGSGNADYIQCLKSHEEETLWLEKVRQLEQAHKPVLLLGDAASAAGETLNLFAETFGCHVVGPFDACPEDADLVITLTADRQEGKTGLRHWHVSPGAVYHNPFGTLETVFVAPAQEFFSFFLAHAAAKKGLPAAAKSIAAKESVLLPLYQAAANCAAGGILQMSCRWDWDSFGQVQQQTGTEVYANSSPLSGGAVSTFLGIAFHSGKEAFLIVDDVALFDDINSLMTRNIEPNLHILLVNAGASSNAAYTACGTKTGDHFSVWAADAGFKYLCAKDVQEALSLMNEFGAKGNRPVVMEVHHIA